jgi:hypothetical protein
VKTFHLRYVPHAEAWLYALAGWRFANALRRSHHGVWSSIMRWNREGPPVEPGERRL